MRPPLHAKRACHLTEVRQTDTNGRSSQPPSRFVSLPSYIFIRAASDDELSRFHSREYVAALRRYGSHGGQDDDDDAEDDGDGGSLDDDEIFEFGLGKCQSASQHSLRQVICIYVVFSAGYDCPVIPELSDFVSLVAGSSICAAKCLVNREGVKNVMLYIY